MRPAEDLSITLPAEMARIIRDKVSAGNYSSISEIIREALHSWVERERGLLALDTAVACGVADAEAGRVQTIGTVREELRKHLEP